MALGGDIHQKVYCEPGYDDHREDADDPVEDQYGHSHQVSLVAGSWFAELMGEEAIPVNSLHGQGIKTLAKGLAPLAYAEDGLIEALHAPELPQFTLAVQWHPEWKATENPHSIKLFEAFGAACRRHRMQAG
ncbi:Gamma-glutamyl-gamma-aminobutyrate hydrolase PuuD [compost metagenome]